MLVVVLVTFVVTWLPNLLMDALLYSHACNFPFLANVLKIKNIVKGMEFITLTHISAHVRGNLNTHIIVIVQ